MSHELPKAYDPDGVEDALYRDWDEAGLFHAEPDDDGEPFSIVIPPPNVTGSLHVGHALDNTIQDALVRRARMQGRNAVWMPGTDHAGIATQNVVERQLADEGKSRHDVGREAFLERVWEWREESGGIILDQLRTLGASCDWDREVFTFDEQRSKAVREVFVSLYEQGLIYRGDRLINWCPRCHTALSDIEVEHEEVRGEMVRFLYPYADSDDGVDAAGGEGGLEVATTRAETMLGDTAIAVHPDDGRYTSEIGRRVRHPFFDRELEVVADDYVDPEFGTGAVKITPAHDPNDFEIGERHGLEVIDVLTDEAAVNDHGGEFAGLDRFEAREAVKRRLEELELLLDVEEHVHQVGHCYRCGTIIEPRLSEQWFVSVRPLADRAIEAVEAGRISFIPESRRAPFLHWLENLHDWCISRQIWWGHRIPAWYGPDGEVEVSREDIDRDGWVQDEDVLDTWFSSQLWPFTVFDWPDTGEAFDTWFPTSVLVTAYDINTFWVSRMVMISLWMLEEVPFHVVHNHGLVRDEHGKKMSKSIGNVIDPLDLIEEYGADATRFALLKSAAPGSDVPLSVDWVDGERRFANKLWNATRFALQNLEGTRPGTLPPVEDLALEDRWILSRLETVRGEVDEAYDGCEWAVVCPTLRSFAWSELADWYLEAVKVRMYGDDDAARDVARRVLAAVLDDLLRLLHPVMPFVTERMWRALTGADGGEDSLMVADWPQPRPGVLDRDAEDDFAVVQDLVTEIRRFRSQHRIAPSTSFAVTVASDERALLSEESELIASLAGLEGLAFVDEIEERPGTSRIVFTSGEAQVSLAGLIDVAAELERLGKDLEAARGDLDYVEGKLANEDFVENAPADVVQGERDKREEIRRRIGELDAQMERLRGLEAG